jgi:hypothetical protein
LRPHETAIEQACDGFIDLAAREFTGQSIDDGFRTLPSANAGGDCAVKFTAKKNLPVLRIETDAIGRQDVN